MAKQWEINGTPASAAVDQIIELSRLYGSDAKFVLAGGGNTSVKSKDRLLVKASGHALATIGPDGFVELDRAKLQAILQSTFDRDKRRREEQYKHAILASRVHPERNQRPSVEALLHHLIPAQYVVHSHNTLVNMLCCCRQGPRICQELFGDKVLWIPYVDPGFVLAQTVDDALRKRLELGREPQAIFMQNHGLIVWGDEAEQVRQRTEQVLSTLRARLDQSGSTSAFGPVSPMAAQEVRVLLNIIGPALRGLLAESPERLKVAIFDDTPLAMELAGGAEGPEAALAGPMTPDHIVYCSSFPLWFEPRGKLDASSIVSALSAAIQQHKRERRYAPTMVIVRGMGLFAIGDDIKNARMALSLYRNGIEVMAGARRLGSILPMSEDQLRFIEEWEVESYRKQLSVKTSTAGRVAGKVALVTGAAQGFGLGIAQALAEQGACVALADLNEGGAKNEAAELCRKYGEGRALGLGMNVTDSASVQAAIAAVVRSYGGLDLLVSNAGVLKAGSVKSQSEKEFDFVTSVNYKGYFLCVQNVSPVMAAQRQARPDYYSDIIQINSKSGLQGSNRNFAYAGSKFGGVGLTQSFAMELIEDGIKVNAICPGNFFDGPLWADPNQGLFVQYLRSGKVPGAKTIEDVKRAYEAKVPMGRGCAVADVMKAIYYLVDQKYETGQALPVTGGQVMLK